MTHRSAERPPTLRATNLEKLGAAPFDVLVVGGGVNGAVSAAALAAWGARVALVDRADFASATSQESSNLIWGGIKYLEGMEFGLVRKLCRARNELMRAYASSVQEIRFFTSIARGFRFGRWVLVLGALLYWAIGGFFTRAPRVLSRRRIAREEPVIDTGQLQGGFEYSDAILPDNDARFVWGFVRAALDFGCVAVNHAGAEGSVREGEHWVTRVRDAVSGRTVLVRSRVVVNACGPWADAVNARDGVRTAHRHVLSKGVHLVVDRVTPNRRVLAFFADDGRLFFVIPMGAKSCIGTTDTPVSRPEVGVTPEDRRFVLDNINKRLRLPRPLEERDVVAERCGVRPLAMEAGAEGPADWMQLSRRHVLDVDPSARRLTIFGGKLTDCLNVGDEVCEIVQGLGVDLPFAGRRWWGEPHASVRKRFLHEARLLGLEADAPPDAAEPRSERLWRRYGAAAFAMLEAIRRDRRAAELIVPGSDFMRCELEETARREMVVTLEDFLRRRTAIALVVRREALHEAPGLRDACEILFGEEAQRRWAEYFSSEVSRVGSSQTVMP